MLKNTYKILRIFAKYPWKKFTFKEVKSLSRSKSESYVFDTLKGFVRESVLSREKVGNVVIYRVNKTSKSLAYLAMVSEYESLNKKYLPLKDLDGLFLKIPSSFFTVLVAGSYAKKKQTKKSDIDLVILANEPKKVYSELRHLCDLNIPHIHLYVFNEEEFLQMLLSNKQNYGKEVVRNNLVLSGGETYFRIVLEAIKNGFNG